MGEIYWFMNLPRQRQNRCLKVLSRQYDRLGLGPMEKHLAMLTAKDSKITDVMDTLKKLRRIK